MARKYLPLSAEGAGRERKTDQVEQALGIVLGVAFVLIYPAIFITGFGLAVGIAAAIPPYSSAW